MRQYKFFKNGRCFKRINRKKAKRLFLQGTEVFCWPCKMDPANPFYGGLYSSANFYEYDPLDESRFERWENNATYYNCDGERGRYLAFYVEKTCYLKSDEFGVAVRFENERDRTRYLNDKLTSDTFEPCTFDECLSFMMDGGYTWDTKRTYYDGTLDGLAVTFSIPTDML